MSPLQLAAASESATVLAPVHMYSVPLLASYLLDGYKYLV